MNCKYPTGIACYLFTVSDYNVFKCLEILMFVTFVDALNQCRRRLPQCQSMHSFHLAWAIAIRCYKASPMDYCRNFSQFKMRQHVLSQEHGGVTTSHQCYMICTGCLFDKELHSRLPVWFFTRCLDRLRNI